MFTYEMLLACHLYADDNHFYLAFSPKDSLQQMVQNASARVLIKSKEIWQNQYDWC